MTIRVTLLVCVAALLLAPVAAAVNRSDRAARRAVRELVSQVESCFADHVDYRKCNSFSELGGSSSGLEWGRDPGEVRVLTATRLGYVAQAFASNGKVAYRITRRSSGLITRTCAPRGVSSCPANGRW
jgi:type IV pilus assembly protein PilA